MAGIDALNASLPEDIRVFDIQRTGRHFSARTSANARTYSYTLPTAAFCFQNQQSRIDDYRITSSHLDLVNALLQKYVGLHKFHNFTINVKPTDQIAFRSMESLKCDRIFEVNGVEFAVIQIRGRSFMMHQIRRMVGLLLAVTRGVVDDNVFERAFSNSAMEIPTAPGHGLVLDEVHYDFYSWNNTQLKKQIHLRWADVTERIDDFNARFIQPTIIRNEIEENLMLNWVSSLSDFTYEIEEPDI